MDYKELLEYGCLKFENNAYDEALEIFIWLYQNGYEQEWILENIYSCYINGNENEFRESFNESIESSICSYNDCKLDFVPYRDGEYFIFDKIEKTFEGVFSVNEFETDDLPDVFKLDEFSDVVIELDWDYRKFARAISGAKGRKLYVIANDIEKAASFYKIPEFKQICGNIKLFLNEKDYKKFFHENIMMYLPKIMFAENNQYEERLKIIFDEEHTYRLTDDGRNKDNILLTIGIPTHNRGNLVLKRLEHLLTIKYDTEIEIVVAKNGDTLYQAEYEEASKIKDSRYIYYGVDEELRPEINWYNVAKMAHGKYVLFVSDEDEVLIESLAHYLKIIRDSNNVSQIRAKTSSQYKNLKDEYCKQGEEAFKLFFLGQNYLSGLIVNRKKFLEADILSLEKYWDNAFYRTYPHEWWCAYLSKMGDGITDSVLLIEEKEPVLRKELQMYEQMGKVKKNEWMDTSVGLPVYATFDGRFEQFLGQVDFLKLFTSDDVSLLYAGIKMTIDKLAVLIYITSTYGCKKDEYMQIISRFVQVTEEIISEFEFSKEQINELRVRIKANENYLMLKGKKIIHGLA